MEPDQETVKLKLMELMDLILEDDQTVLRFTTTRERTSNPIYSIGSSEPVQFAPPGPTVTKVVIEFQS